MTRLLQLAWRSIWRNKRRTALAILSIGLGLALAVFFVSLRNGVYARLVDEAVRMQGGHITLEHPSYRQAPSVDLVIGGVAELQERIRKLPSVERTKTLVLGQALIKSGGGSVGVMVVGVEPSEERDASPLAGRIVAGRYLEDDNEAMVVIGRQLADRLKVIPGKKAVIAVSNVRGEMAEELTRVKGVFATGSPEVDGYVVQIPIGFARKLFGMQADQCTQLGVILRDPNEVPSQLAVIRQLARGAHVAVRPWQEVIPDVASFVQIGRAANGIYQGLLNFLILFTIFNTLLMSVVERRREFAVLLALGTPPILLRLQVLVETALIGLMGCTAGMLVGGLAAYAAQEHGIDLRHFIKEGVNLSGFAFDLVVRTRLTPAILFGFGGSIFAATLLLSVYPMRVATRIELAELLR